MRHPIVPALTALMLGAVLGGCTGNDRAGEPAAQPDRQVVGAIATDPAESAGPAPPVPGARAGGTVTVIRQTALARRDPQRIYSFLGLNASQLYARRLTTFADDGQGRVRLVGDLAETPGTDVGGDCRTWEFRIKRNVRFEDGTVVTARDIAYGIARSFDLALTGGPTYLQEWLAGTPRYDTVFDFAADRSALPPGLSAPDPRTLRLAFDAPHCDLPFAASLPATAPVPAARDTGVGYDARPVSSGPYRITGTVPGTSITLERNPHWDPATDPVRHQYPDRFVLEFGPDPATQINRIIGDRGADRTAVSWDGVGPSLVARVLGDAGLRTRTLQSPASTLSTLTINTRRVTDLAVRRALNYAVDRDGLVKTLGGAVVARPVTTLMPPATIGRRDYDAYPAGPGGDPRKARELLGGASAELVLAFPDDAEGQTVGAFLKGNLERAGFRIRMKMVPAGSFLEETKKRDNPWDLYPGSWAADWPSGSAILPVLYDGRSIKADGSNNGTSYLDAPALNAEFDRVLRLPPGQQGPGWAALDEKIMREYAPVVPLYVEMTFTLHGSQVGGLFVDSIFGGPAFVNAFVAP
ncbi:ABC transporter substrate-binding protein [Couchioplanes azureus]|uniref:ABC transporter substrate-binding protein n=1 Tax=Couchioplanes caeruleus TaxID=56438 RepID=UPI001670434B|nr:ABC transporter substrate-binding protein [Couchioplanes caeruleus]GGQ75754.1 ABC transporter [Couchioplanes caeruleus subsp. azureus]